jgi:hypothetical protein
MFRAGQQSAYFPRAPLGMVYWGKDSGVLEKYGFGNILNNWSPRIGFAFDPKGDGRMSVRGGYGIFYASRSLQMLGGGGPGFVLTTNLNPVPGGLANPYQTIGGNPYPFKPPQTEQERQTFNFVRPVSVGGWDANYRNGVVQQWNFSVQRQMWHSWLFTAAYVASKGNHLDTTRQVNPGVFGRAGNLQQRRVYPDFAAIGIASTEGNYTYNSLQLTANKRLTRGFTMLASYTWSRNIDNLADPQNGSDFSREKAISPNNIDHRVVGSFIWELPKPGGHRALRAALGGWEVNGIVAIESGLFFNVLSGRDNSGTGINQDRPDLIGNPFLDTGRSRNDLITRYFNPAAFQQNANGTLGNAGRNLIPGPGEALVDLGLVKTFAITERHRIRFRAEAFNAFNRVNLDNPVGNLLAPNVARITGAGAPRVFQLALRYEF